jgi:hypothetical protein
MATAGKIGGKRKIWFTKMIVVEYPSGLKAGATGDGKPNAAKEIKVASVWKAGKSKNKYK